MVVAPKKVTPKKIVPKKVIPKKIPIKKKVVKKAIPKKIEVKPIKSQHIVSNTASSNKAIKSFGVVVDELLIKQQNNKRWFIEAKTGYQSFVGTSSFTKTNGTVYLEDFEKLKTLVS